MKMPVFAKTILLLSVSLPNLASSPADEQTIEPPQRLSGSIPEYPDMARRYNVQGAVLVLLTIDTDGRVDKTQILESPADILSEAVVRATRDWRYSKPAVPASVKMRIPFTLTGDEYAFDTAVRPLVSAPKDRTELRKKIVDGWCDVRLIVDKKGAVAGKFHLKMSDPKFRSTSEAIIDALKFEAAPDGTPESRSTAVNLFTIRVTDGSKIEVSQLAGD